MTSTLPKESLGAFPTELCLQVLRSLESKTAISALIRASPRMLRVYLEYKAEIIWHILASDFDKDIIQDAVFIIQLPRSVGPTYIREDFEPCKAIVDQWFAKDLPDPIASQDKSSYLFWSLDKLHSVLIRLIEDYITKAKAKYIVQSYPCLPQMGPLQRHLTFKGIEIMPRMDAGLLQQSQRSKLLRSFLSYEWIAKTMRARSLLKALGSHGLMPARRELSLSDTKALVSVKAYIASLYQAIFAQIIDSKLPEPEQDFCPETEDLDPDFATTFPVIYSTFKMYRQKVVDLPEGLAELGLDVLFAFLGLDVTRADDTQLIEDHFKVNCGLCVGHLNARIWLGTHLAVERNFEWVVLVPRTRFVGEVQDWRACEFLMDDSENMLIHRMNRWRDQSGLWVSHDGARKRSFNIELQFHKRRTEREGKSARAGRNPLPQALETVYGFLEQSPAFWRVGLQSL